MIVFTWEIMILFQDLKFTALESNETSHPGNCVVSFLIYWGHFRVRVQL